MSIAIIGIGSPWGLDQIGWMITQALKHAKKLQNLDIHFEILDRPQLRLLNILNNYDSVIIIDAVVSDAEFGKLYCKDISELIDVNLPQSSHGIKLQDTLALAEALQQLPPSIKFYGININQEINKKLNLLSQLYKLRQQIKDKIFHATAS